MHHEETITPLFKNITKLETVVCKNQERVFF